MRHKKAVPIWKSKIPLCSDEPGHPGRRFASPQAVAGYVPFTVPPQKTNAKSAKRKGFWYSEEGKKMKRFMRAVLDQRDETHPVLGKAGRWKPFMTANGPAISVTKQRDGDCVARFQMNNARTPRDRSYGTGMDVESRAQMSKWFESFIGNLS